MIATRCMFLSSCRRREAPLLPAGGCRLPASSTRSEGPCPSRAMPQLPRQATSRLLPEMQGNEATGRRSGLPACGCLFHSLIRAPALAPKTTPSSSELLARRFAPCTPVQATSPAAKKRAQVGAPVQVRPHAAHRVVRGRVNRRRVFGQVHAVLQAGFVDPRKARADQIAARGASGPDR